jgi:hypothetical protein
MHPNDFYNDIKLQANREIDAASIDDLIDTDLHVDLQNFGDTPFHPRGRRRSNSPLADGVTRRTDLGVFLNTPDATPM